MVFGLIRVVLSLIVWRCWLFVRKRAVHRIGRIRSDRRAEALTWIVIAIARLFIVNVRIHSVGVDGRNRPVVIITIIKLNVFVLVVKAVPVIEAKSVLVLMIVGVEFSRVGRGRNDLTFKLVLGLDERLFVIGADRERVYGHVVQVVVVVEVFVLLFVAVALKAVIVRSRTRRLLLNIELALVYVAQFFRKLVYIGHLAQIVVVFRAQVVPVGAVRMQRSRGRVLAEFMLICRLRLVVVFVFDRSVQLLL